MSNRLAAESSPYLLQHASNPVDWYPWAAEALERSRALNRPIFLSIGYSTCHWCHVMERESFEDAGVAAALNAAFVCIKVDREERPDIDGLYMSAAQMMGGRGGWPLTVLLTPALEPFFAATYLPRESRPGLIGLLDLVAQVHELWRDRRADVERSAAEIAQALRDALAPDPPRGLDQQSVTRDAVEHLAATYDPVHGGFGAPPKFPSPHTLMFLLGPGRRHGADAGMADRTLRRMRLGGIWDHVGYGFHRYSTDAEWLVPHFEKMLYDQALMVLASLDAFAAGLGETHARTARETLEYVGRDLRSADGAFFSAEDADSEGAEGRFYLWSAAEIHALVGDDAPALLALMNASEGGNFGDGLNILHLSPPGPVAGADEALWQRCRPRLLLSRRTRPRPLLDDKVLADWNGLAIAALARAARVLGDDSYAQAAAAAAAFVLGCMREPSGRLLHCGRAGLAAIPGGVRPAIPGRVRPAIPGLLDDYAFMLWGLIELHQATLDATWLAEAVSVADLMLADFRDEDGGLLVAPSAAPVILSRRRESVDNATPSGNSVAACELLRLSRLTGRHGYEEAARAILRAFSAPLARHPQYHTRMLSALDLADSPSVEVVVVTDRPRDALAVCPPGVLLLAKRDSEDALEQIAPFTRGMRAMDGRPTWYVCRDHACELPTSDAAAALQRMAQVSAVN